MNDGDVVHTWHNDGLPHEAPHSMRAVFYDVGRVVIETKFMDKWIATSSLCRTDAEQLLVAFDKMEGTT